MADDAVAPIRQLHRELVGHSGDVADIAFVVRKHLGAFQDFILTASRYASFGSIFFARLL